VTGGREISADEAERIGLVNHVYDDDEFDEEVANFARGFEKASRSAITLSKQLLYFMDGMSFETALQSGVDVNAIARMTEDCKQGIARFLKK
jgi:methylglutaconyl-CoA hydratase